MHYTVLKLYSALELRLEKVNRVVSFNQYDWLKNSAFDKNTGNRVQPINNFGKDLYKLFNNSVIR